MRDYEETIREAELLAGSPEAVVSYLKDRAARLALEKTSDEGDEELEQALLGLNHPLVDIALARYCRHTPTAKALFHRESKALRLALLTNQVLARSIFGYSIAEIFDSDQEKLRNFLTGASDEEIYALFQNPKIDDSFIRDLLEGNYLWEALSEERKQMVVGSLHRNERMKTPYDESFMDGYAEYSYGAVFNAAWKLSETLPVTDKWASTLHWLYDQLQPDAHSIDNPLTVAARWFPQSAESIEQEKEAVGMGFTSGYQGVRQGLAKLALAKFKADAKTLLESDDVAFRAAAYRNADLTVEQIGAAYEKDGELAFQEMVHNKHLWKRANKRQALHDVAWSVVNNDKHSDLMAANIFNGVRERFAKEHPDWFRDEEDFTPEPSDEPVTKADLEALATRLATPIPAMEQIKAKLDTIHSRLGFVWWFSLGTLVGVFSRHI